MIEPPRYKIQQDKGHYCLKRCADGDLMDYAEHVAIVERLQRQVAELEAEVQAVMAGAYR